MTSDESVLGAGRRCFRANCGWCHLVHVVQVSSAKSDGARLVLARYTLLQCIARVRSHKRNSGCSTTDQCSIWGLWKRKQAVEIVYLATFIVSVVFLVLVVLTFSDVIELLPPAPAGAVGCRVIFSIGYCQKCPISHRKGSVNSISRPDIVPAQEQRIIVCVQIRFLHEFSSMFILENHWTSRICICHISRSPRLRSRTMNTCPSVRSDPETAERSMEISPTQFPTQTRLLVKQEK